jgi:hypothetical protein
MPTLAAFLDGLFTRGEVALDGPVTPDAAAVETLRHAHSAVALDLAGPPVPFDPAPALAAAEAVAAACWRLVSGDGPEPRSRLPREPRTTAEHLSADLTLRYLPAVHHRARLLAATEPLAAELAELLRRWPLSGVLADLAAPPLTDLEFAGHPGLQLLYAERLLVHEKDDWFPPDGPSRAVAELVYHERGRAVPGPREEAGRE